VIFGIFPKADSVYCRTIADHVEGPRPQTVSPWPASRGRNGRCIDPDMVGRSASSSGFGQRRCGPPKPIRRTKRAPYRRPLCANPVSPLDENARSFAFGSGESPSSDVVRGRPGIGTAAVAVEREAPQAVAPATFRAGFRASREVEARPCL
jgi:hypothetical protein